MEPNGLALEYKRDYGTARRDLNVADLVNNPAASGKCSILGLSLQEELVDIRLSKFRSLFDDRPYAFLIAPDAVQALK